MVTADARKMKRTDTYLTIGQIPKHLQATVEINKHCEWRFQSPNQCKLRYSQYCQHGRIVRGKRQHIRHSESDSDGFRFKPFGHLSHSMLMPVFDV